MKLRVLFLCCFAAVATFFGAETGASACITNAACTGTTPTCDLLTFTCRGCENDIDCGAPLSGDICQIETGKCVSESTGDKQNCSIDSDCDTLGGFVCSGTACVLGCHITVLGDTCIFGTQCTIGFGLTIGTCEPTGGGSGSSSGGSSSGGSSSGSSSSGSSSSGSSSSGSSSSGSSSSGSSSSGSSSSGSSAAGDASTTPGCVTDADCISRGEVCDIGPGGAACVPGCHDTPAGDTCPKGTTCSVTGGGLGVCISDGDGGPLVCTKDSDCGAPGLVCDGGSCVVGCHDTGANGDTCPAGAQCSVMGGGLGVCIPSAADAGVMKCTADSDCLPGLVCVDGECANGCHATSAGDTCAAGAHCNVLDGGIGDCVGGMPPGTTCSTDSDCSGGLICVGSVCVVGCDVSSGGSGAPVDSCLVGGTCSAADGGVGQCVGSDGGLTPACGADSDCEPGLVCVGGTCVVGCHDTSAGGDTCIDSVCSAIGGALGVCIATGADGGVVGCTLDSDCPTGDVCDDGECAPGCHVIAGVDTCPQPFSCDARNGSLGVCAGGSAEMGSPDAASIPDATIAESGGDGGGGSPVVEGGGCGCTVGPTSGTGAAMVLVALLAFAVIARRRAAK